MNSSDCSISGLHEFLATPFPVDVPTKRSRSSPDHNDRFDESDFASSSRPLSKSPRGSTSTFLEDVPALERRLLLAEHQVAVKSLALQQRSKSQLTQQCLNDSLEVTPLLALPSVEWIRQYLSLFTRLLNEHNLTDLVSLVFTPHHHSHAKHVARVWIPSCQASSFPQFTQSANLSSSMSSSCSSSSTSSRSPVTTTTTTHIPLSAPSSSASVESITLAESDSCFLDQMDVQSECPLSQGLCGDKPSTPHLICWQEYLGVTSSVEYLRLLFASFPDSVFEVLSHAESPTSFGLKVVVLLRFRGTLVDTRGSAAATLQSMSSPSSSSSSSSPSPSFFTGSLHSSDEQATSSTSVPPHPFAWLYPLMGRATQGSSDHSPQDDEALSEAHLLVYCSIFFDSASHKIYETWSDVVLSSHDIPPLEKCNSNNETI